MLVRDGHPIVDGVYVNCHGPYRFLVDTGSNVNLIDQKLAQSIGLTAAFQTELATSAGATVASGNKEVEVSLDSAKAADQEFLFRGLETIRRRWPDIQGVLGQWFLSRFDYTLDLRGKQLTFGKQDRSGTHTPFRMINGRLSFSTSLGNLILDSAADRLVLFGVKPDTRADGTNELRTVAGSQQIGVAFSKPLTIDGRRIWRGDAVALPNRTEPGVDGLLPLSLFKAVYVCNSEGYVVFE